jgi:hypothetical protein
MFCTPYIASSRRAAGVGMQPLGQVIATTEKRHREQLLARWHMAHGMHSKLTGFRRTLLASGSSSFKHLMWPVNKGLRRQGTIKIGCKSTRGLALSTANQVVGCFAAECAYAREGIQVNWSSIHVSWDIFNMSFCAQHIRQWEWW